MLLNGGSHAMKQEPLKMDELVVAEPQRARDEQ
jgi:hypothetical protein